VRSFKPIRIFWQDGVSRKQIELIISSVEYFLKIAGAGDRIKIVAFASCARRLFLIIPTTPNPSLLRRGNRPPPTLGGARRGLKQAPVIARPLGRRNPVSSSLAFILSLRGVPRRRRNPRNNEITTFRQVGTRNDSRRHGITAHGLICCFTIADIDNDKARKYGIIKKL